MADVNKTLADIFREDYSFLKQHFATPSLETPEPPQPSLTQVAAPAKASKPVRITGSTKIKVNKEPVQETPQTTPQESEKTHQEEVLEEQEKKETEKFAELVKQGINPESLLTKENLTDWLQTKEYSFAYIARELVGLSQAQVRYAAKLYKIESPVSIRRKGLIAAKIKGKN